MNNIPPLLQKVIDRKKRLESDRYDIAKSKDFSPKDKAVRLFVQMVSARIHELEIIIAMIRSRIL